VVNTTPAGLAAKKATNTIPIVHVSAIDPVGAGLAASLARPGGNVTGVALLFPEMSAKGLTLLKEAVPGLSRVAALWNAANPGNISVWRETEIAARASSLVLHSQPVRTPADFEGAFVAIAQVRPDGLLILGDVLLFQQRKPIIDFTTQKRLPMIAPFRELADVGGLMSYGPDIAEAMRGSAKHIDRILKGAKPGDLPFEQATKFERVINLKTAKALGLTIPPSLLLRADQVIE
jgi:putative ABC transport system substrate-binding protein